MVLSINVASLGVVDSHTLCPKTVRVKPLWHRLLGFLGRPASESGPLCRGDRDHGRGDRATGGCQAPGDLRRGQGALATGPRPGSTEGFSSSPRAIVREPEWAGLRNAGRRP
jgi:hypothetical protein